MSGETDKNLTSSDYYKPNKTKKTRNHKANKSDAIASKEFLPSDVNAALSKKNNQNFQRKIRESGSYKAMSDMNPRVKSHNRVGGIKSTAKRSNAGYQHNEDISEMNKTRKMLIQKQIEVNSKLARKNRIMRKGLNYEEDEKNQTVHLPDAIRRPSQSKAYSAKHNTSKWGGNTSGYSTYSNYSQLGYKSKNKFVTNQKGSFEELPKDVKQNMQHNQNNKMPQVKKFKNQYNPLGNNRDINRTVNHKKVHSKLVV